MQTEVSAGDILEADHRELDQLLAELVDQLAADLPDLVAVYHKLDLFWARLAVHIRAEHLVLFPAVVAAASENNHERLVAIIGDLRHDHDFFIKELARAIKALRLVPDFGNEAETFVIIRELLDGVSNRLVPHNAIEEKGIYPLADRETSSRVLKELDNLPKRFSVKPKTI
jgi:iron-sulfur cluster repair protein YtfE (RIC family)